MTRGFTWSTTTPTNKEGINISWKTEDRCSESLRKRLPNQGKGWELEFEWVQILFSDVQYEINHEDKLISIAYNQNLSHWWNKVEDEIIKSIEDYEKI